MERRRSSLRSAVVWEALEPVLQARHTAVDAARPLQVVDLGGGTGGLAVRVAELGHQVVVVDPSPDALASLERRAEDAGVSATVRGVLGDADTLLDVVEPASADIVLCHGVLEVVDKPDQALAAAADALLPGGSLSVLAAQRSAAVFSRALAGHLAEARALLDGPDGSDEPTDTGVRRFSSEELCSLVVGAGFTLVQIHGVRIFVDHISSAVVDSDPRAAAELHALEAAVASSPDYMGVATQLHLLATPAAAARATTATAATQD